MTMGATRLKILFGLVFIYASRTQGMTDVNELKDQGKLKLSRGRQVNHEMIAEVQLDVNQIKAQFVLTLPDLNGPYDAQYHGEQFGLSKQRYRSFLKCCKDQKFKAIEEYLITFYQKKINSDHCSISVVNSNHRP